MRETTQVKEVGTRSGEEPQEEAKRIDLSVPQVAGSAVAAVAGAVAASQLGVYGTVIGSRRDECGRHHRRQRLPAPLPPHRRADT